MNESLKKALQYFYTFVCWGIPVLLAAGGVLGVKWVNDNPTSKSSDERTNIVFLGIYMIVFAFVLFWYEVVSCIGNDFLDLQMKKNFGFMYGPIGKGLYTTMIGIFAFGLQEPAGFGIACGIVVGGWGICTIALAVVVQDFFPPRTKYIP